MTPILRSMSPATQKAIAVLLLLLAVLCAWQFLLHPLWNAAKTRVESLNDARFERARMAALNQRVLPASTPTIPLEMFLASNATLQSGDIGASNQLVTIISQRAAVMALSSLTIQPVQNGTNLATVTIMVEGRQDKIVRLIATLESGNPLIRFDSWQIEVLDKQKGTIRFSATAQAPSTGQ